MDTNGYVLGFVMAGGRFADAISAPEPSSDLMLAVGGLACFGLGSRRGGA